jgi:hypothetical protein
MKKTKEIPAEGLSLQISPVTAPAAMRKGNALLLTLGSSVIIFLFFLLIGNIIWFNDRIIQYWKEYSDQSSNLDIEYRKSLLGKPYTLSVEIAKGIPPQYKNNALVLMPSQSYFKERGVDYHVPIPVVFYYYTGIKTVWANSKDASKATYCFTLENGAGSIEKISDSVRLKKLIALFNTYTYDL